MLQPTPRRLVAILLLTLTLWGSIGSLGIGVAGLLLPRPAEAQGEGGGGLLGSLLGGDGGGILPLLLIIMLLMQLFGGGQGGSTPQENAPVEEQPSFFQPSVGPQQTGPRAPPPGPAPQGAPPPAAVLPVQPPAPVSLPVPIPPSSSVLPGPTLTFQIPPGADTGALSPNTATIQPGSAVTVNNAATVPATFTVRRTGQTASLAQVSVAGGVSHRIRFQNTGTFELVSGTNVLGTVTVR